MNCQGLLDSWEVIIKLYLEHIYVYIITHMQKPKSSRTTKSDYRLKASNINNYRRFVVYAD